MNLDLEKTYQTLKLIVVNEWVLWVIMVVIVLLFILHSFVKNLKSYRDFFKWIKGFRTPAKRARLRRNGKVMAEKIRELQRREPIRQRPHPFTSDPRMSTRPTLDEPLTVGRIKELIRRSKK